MATRDKFIFPSSIMRTIRHVFVSYLDSAHFSIMSAISSASIRRSKAQLQSKRPWTETATPLASSTPSTSTLSASASGVTFKVVIAQLQCMNARLDTLTTELYQVNTRVSRIAWRHARLGGFIKSPFPSPEASKDEDDDGNSSDNDDDEDENASSSDNDEITTFQWLALCHSWQKGEVILGMKVVTYLEGELV